MTWRMIRLRGDAASCGSHSEALDANPTAGILPAHLVTVGTWTGFFLAALRAARVAHHRRHPAASRLRAMDHPGAGHPCPAPFNAGTQTPLARIS
jgi:hypothetical protein